MKLELKINLEPPRSLVRLSLVLGAAIAAFGTAMAVVHADVKVPNLFAKQQSLSADQMNTNFAALAAAIPQITSAEQMTAVTTGANSSWTDITWVGGNINVPYAVGPSNKLLVQVTGVVDSGGTASSSGCAMRIMLDGQPLANQDETYGAQAVIFVDANNGTRTFAWSHVVTPTAAGSHAVGVQVRTSGGSPGDMCTFGYPSSSPANMMAVVLTSF